jgi:hypothetical protein
METFIGIVPGGIWDGYNLTLTASTPWGYAPDPLDPDTLYPGTPLDWVSPELLPGKPWRCFPGDGHWGWVCSLGDNPGGSLGNPASD